HLFVTSRIETLNWTVTQNGVVTCDGCIELMVCAGESVQIELNGVTIPRTANALNYLNLEVVLNANTAWANKGHVTAIE
ncbi:beta-galactosidase domain 4-containing protein, partial [Vibrio sp. 10N.222.52.B7]|uniref:beta-galactosidase domain 4-containing protein n=1 Tax=Vibrio sp. 10N.222.52.B7 TaxID=3229629 RepID=UPI00354C125F